jgi:hypothetical protein
VDAEQGAAGLKDHGPIGKVQVGMSLYVSFDVRLTFRDVHCRRWERKVKKEVMAVSKPGPGPLSGSA